MGGTRPKTDSLPKQKLSMPHFAQQNHNFWQPSIDIDIDISLTASMCLL